jgi:hypothetical protein
MLLYLHWRQWLLLILLLLLLLYCCIVCGACSCCWRSHDHTLIQPMRQLLLQICRGW